MRNDNFYVQEEQDNLWEKEKKKTFVFTRIGLVITFFLEVYFEISNIIIKKKNHEPELHKK